MNEPIAKCRGCRGEGIIAGEPLPEVCEACTGLGIVATERPPPFDIFAKAKPPSDPDELPAHELAHWSAWYVAPLATCGCGAAYDAASWKVLNLATSSNCPDGRMDDGDGGQLELRNCPCGSTLSIQLSRGVAA